MTPLASFARFASGTTFALVLISACGGKSFSGTDGGDGGTTAAGGSSHAGATNEAGQAHGGTGAGGSITYAGTGAGGITTAGTGGGTNSDPACSAAPASGTCDALFFPSWYHDTSTGICRPFVYGGCGGNKNRYDSLEACQKACPGGNPNYDACKQPSDCVVTGTGCCGICDSPNLTPWDLISYNRQDAQFLQCAIALDDSATRLRRRCRCANCVRAVSNASARQ